MPVLNHIAIGFGSLPHDTHHHTQQLKQGIFAALLLLY
ncbi:hypothetical protein N476_14325 [Pseudoalteromonas luteoviolacea H33]|uniref:Uncharacterized protein n=1 Tax=Pseudoalteromonas luteoviolacea H33 TaxID=1365251 RepID=A0A162AJL0_9GAMM|nr:hypothetical protein N476_14325 [Pseudoalteromonas luteoviolacea H33]KZN72140.1 hypothetical protein N477_03100 [Pseudoalteromonas luteoviolacea H33-S]